MVFQNRNAILDGLKQTPKVRQSQIVGSGREAAIATIGLMRNTFKALPPAKIVQAYVDIGKGGKAASTRLWSLFGRQTIGVMQDGANLLAALWESAWTVGEGERNVTPKSALTTTEAMDIVKDDKFLPSMTIGQIGKVLRGLPERQPEKEAEPIKSARGRRTSPPRNQRTQRTPAGSRQDRSHVQRGQA